MTVLSCTGLSRRFGDVLAVDDVSFTIAEGETYGLLGPNGAGKTTTISMITGVLAPDSGEVLVAGQPMSTRAIAAKRLVGYVPQELALYPDLSGRENLRFFASLYGAKRSRVDHVLDVVGLSDRADDLAREYSGGMKRRLNVAIGLLHEPKLLVLDEPTAGVDPQSRNQIMDNVRALAADGMAVLYTTHYMEEAERLCDRVGIIDSGRLVAEGTQRQLVERLGEHDRISLQLDGDLSRAATVLGAVQHVRQVAAHGQGIELVVDDARECLPVVLSAISSNGVVVRSVEVTEPDLETVFLHLTGKALRE
ncbi:ABC transporter ATP-binding protein [Lentzea flaviverrucosa]|uniref:ABC-2 type transport system ATP-binding protein n=1 Tax=Lentzea flaviverrucosa TaxID=200379 RepID=A0A1H9XXJ0_9PSEU|nr:ABC transporter ATP-binding protein [Lentzea flaviverrucosa]RDI34362.1 ABC-2 type transport system ATP-binding protein [Lentzea flaviverrucosa]SES50467.1 ABC-2 type transport system ATP-binding protein [Lentzea flaviverrucosa]